MHSHNEHCAGAIVRVICTRRRPTNSMSINTTPFRYQKVLIIEDDEIDIYISRRIILSSSFAKIAESRSSGKEGLEFLKHTLESGNQLPEVIFLDLEMPEMDGYEFLKEFHRLPDRIKKTCRIVILSNAQSMQPEKVKILRDSPYLVKILRKPLTGENLKQIST